MATRHQRNALAAPRSIRTLRAQTRAARVKSDARACLSPSLSRATCAAVGILLATQGIYFIMAQTASYSRTNNTKTQKISGPTIKSGHGSEKVTTQLAEIDLSRIEYIAPKGRVQDADYNQLKVVDELIAFGTESIPYLISKLDDETEIKGHVMDYWPEVKIGDVALVILSDFFTDSSWKKSTIGGVEWREFLDCKNPGVPASQCLASYIAKHGREGTKAKWQRIWNENQDKIYWDEAERCFKARTP